MSEGSAIDDLSNLILWHREERHLEFKRSMDWADTATKAKLTKSVLAMANLRDEGTLSWVSSVRVTIPIFRLEFKPPTSIHLCKTTFRLISVSTPIHTSKPR